MSHTSASFFLILALFDLLLFVRGEDVDVCTTATNIGSAKRSPSYILNTVEKPQCDESIVTGAWYTFGNSTADRMPEECVDLYHCGSDAPIWLNGTHPTAENPGPVKRQTCAKMKQKGGCCDYSSEIQVKWCQNAATKKDYYVYQLTSPSMCKLSYCAGSSRIKCNANCAWNEVISNCSCPAYPSTTPPVLNQPSITSKKNVIDTRGAPFVATKFSIKCDLGYPQQQVDDGARFLAVLESNGVPIVNVTRRSTEPFVNFDEGYLYGRLGTNITCSVRSYWESNDPQYSKPQVSNVLWFGLQPVTEKGEVIKSPVIKDGDVFAFKIQPNFPITSAKCFEYEPDVACHPIYTFQIVANKNGRVCACRFLLSPLNNVTDLITVSPAPIMGSRTKPFLWEIAFRNQTQEQESSGTIFQDYTIPSIKVQIEDSGTRPICSSIGDPHITAFPAGPNQTRLVFNAFLSGDFDLVSATTRLFQVQVRQFPCGRGVSCNCAVMVREGNNILGIDSCQRGTGAQADWSPRLIRYLTDPEYPSGEIEPTGSGWTIGMLSGVKLNVDRGMHAGYLDIHVIGLRSETYSGLCIYGGTQIASCSSDCEKYRIPAGDSFFNFNSSNTPKCGEPYIVPTCDCYQGDGDNSINVTCSQPKQSNLLKTSYRCEPPPDTRPPTILKPPAVDENDTATVDPDVLNEGKVPLNTSTTPVVPVWPTPVNKINETHARKICNDALVSSKIYKLCSENTNEGAFGFIVEGCVMDIQLLDDTSPVNAVEGQLQRVCVYAFEIGIQETNDGSVPESEKQRKKQLGKVLDNICPNQCSSRGKCVNSACVCESGYIGNDCSLAEGYVPEIKGLLSPVCTVSADTNCGKIYVQTKDLLFGHSVSCKIENAEGQAKDDSSPFVSGGVVICSLVFDVSPGTYSVSISIDGVKFSAKEQYTIRPLGASPLTRPATNVPTAGPPPVTTVPAAGPPPVTPIPTASPLCPDLTVISDELQLCTNAVLEKAKTSPLVNAPCPDLEKIWDELRQCVNTISEKAKPVN